MPFILFPPLKRRSIGTRTTLHGTTNVSARFPFFRFALVAILLLELLARFFALLVPPEGVVPTHGGRDGGGIPTGATLADGVAGSELLYKVEVTRVSSGPGALLVILVLVCRDAGQPVEAAIGLTRSMCADGHQCRTVSARALNIGQITFARVATAVFTARLCASRLRLAVAEAR